MDQDFAQQDDLSARSDAMRERLRLKGERVLEAVEVIGDPNSFLEVERAARAILVVDRMIAQLFSEPRPKSFALIYDDGARYDYGARGRSSASRLPVEKGVYGSVNNVENAPIVSFAATSPVTQGKMSEVEFAEMESAESVLPEQALATEFDPEKEAHANAIYAAYCEFKRLEREAEERFGLGP